MYAMIKRSYTPYDYTGELKLLRDQGRVFRAEPEGPYEYRLDGSTRAFWTFGYDRLDLFPDDTIFLHGVADFPVTGSLEQVLSYISEREQRDWYFYPVSNERDITYGPSRRGRKHSANPKHDRWRVTSIANVAEPVGVRPTIRDVELSLAQISLQLTQGETLATIFGVRV